MWVDCDKKDVASVEQSLNTLISKSSHIKMDTYHAQLQNAEVAARMVIFCWLIGESVASIRIRLYFSEDGLTIHMNKTEETKYNEYMGFLNS